MRAYCHLCEDMLTALRDWQARQSFELEIIDIDADPALIERFNTMVPVLMAGETEICHYFLDEKALSAYFSQA